MRLLASPLIDSTKDGVHHPRMNNQTRHKLIKGGWFDALDGRMLIEYRLAEKGVGRYNGSPYGYHCMSRIARNYLCAQVVVLP
jgi:hypothetical protein